MIYKINNEIFQSWKENINEMNSVCTERSFSLKIERKNPFWFQKKFENSNEHEKLFRLALKKTHKDTDKTSTIKKTTMLMIKKKSEIDLSSIKKMDLISNNSRKKSFQFEWTLEKARKMIFEIDDKRLKKKKSESMSEINFHITNKNILIQEDEIRNLKLEYENKIVIYYFN